MKGRAIGAGLAGGLLAGALVGAVEAMASWAHGHGAGELPALAWAMIAYGGFGALGGIGAGVVAAVLGTDGFGLALAGILAGLGFVVGRFRVIRDVFLEQAPHGGLAMAVQAAALLATVAVAVTIWWRLRGADARRAFITRPLVAAGLVAVLAAAWTAASGSLAPPPAPAPATTAAAPPANAPNVVLIVADTLRADHLGCYGYASAHTPVIDALAAESVRFANAFSQASWTRPSIATILTGQYPSSHGAIHKADALPDRIDTLAEVLARAGYRTAGLADNVNVSPAFNFGQGFGEYFYLAPDFFFWANEPAAQLTLYNGLRLVHERFLSRTMDVHNYYQPADVVSGKAVSWLASVDGTRPFFLFLHYMDAHDPYFVHPFNGEGYARVAMPNPPPEMADKLRTLYDGGIGYFDQHLGAVLAELKRRGLYDSTMVIVTADHGEEFHEHGGWWHGTTLYDEQTHVPLIVKPMRGGAPHVVDGLATSLDIAPSILAAAGIPVPGEMPGHPLPLVPGVGIPRERVFSEEDFEGNVLSAVRTKDWKYMTANQDNPRGLPPEALFDLGQDPKEMTNVASKDAAQLETMRAAHGRTVLEAREHAGAGASANMDDVTLKRLKALGYVGDK